MCPACFDFMPGSTAWMSLRAPKKLTSYRSFAIFIGVHSSTDVKAMPALLTVTRKNCSSYWNSKSRPGRSGKKLHFFTHSIHLQLWHSDANMANSFYNLHHSSSSPEHQYHGNPLLLTTRKKSLIQFSLSVTALCLLKTSEVKVQYGEYACWCQGLKV